LQHKTLVVDSGAAIPVIQTTKPRLNEVDDFFDCTTYGKKPRANGISGLHVVALIGDRGRMVPLRERRPHSASRTRPRYQGKGGGTRHRAAQFHRRGDPAPAALRLGQRGLQNSRGRQGLPPSDIDVMWLGGFNFLRYRGGLMYWADTIGVAEVYRQIQAWHQQYGERWAPSPLLRRLAESGTPLREAKPGRPM
jgi:hypothetical protein